MALRTEEKEFDGGAVRVRVTQLPYFRAQRLLARLLKLAGPGLIALADVAGKSSGKDALAAMLGLQVTDLAPALGQLFERLDPDTIEQITREILAGSQRWDVARGSYVELAASMDALDIWTGLSVQAFGLSVHFGNFSIALGGLGARLGAGASGLPESITSTDGKGANLSAPVGAAS